MNALHQFLQAASNAAASNVSGPVDLIGAALRKLGVPVPQNALMSSQWMEQQGLTNRVPQNALTLAGETFGMTAPIAAAAKAPQIAGALLQGGRNLAAPSSIIGPSAGQRGMALFDTTGFPNRGKDLIQGKADDLAKRLKDLGFNVDIQHSGSVAGPSSYLRVSDPETGRFLKDQFRMSGHSKGPFESQFVTNIATDAEFDNVIESAIKMRGMGKSESAKRMAEAASKHAEKVSAYWESVAKRAHEKLSVGDSLSNKERQALDWMARNKGT